jgi:hypothetical protein
MYCAVIDQCALKQDLEMFAAGDLTEVGEKVCPKYRYLALYTHVSFLGSDVKVNHHDEML